MYIDTSGLDHRHAQVLSLPGPEPKETTRLALRNDELGLVGHVSAMTLAHGSAPGFYHEKAAKLGPDPLREDADMVGGYEARCTLCGSMKHVVWGHEAQWLDSLREYADMGYEAKCTCRVWDGLPELCACVNVSCRCVCELLGEDALFVLQVEEVLTRAVQVLADVRPAYNDASVVAGRVLSLHLQHLCPQEVLWKKVQTSKKPIGLVLMSQDMVAGIGNIYR